MADQTASFTQELPRTNGKTEQCERTFGHWHDAIGQEEEPVEGERPEQHEADEGRPNLAGEAVVEAAGQDGADAGADDGRHAHPHGLVLEGMAGKEESLEFSCFHIYI